MCAARFSTADSEQSSDLRHISNEESNARFWERARLRAQVAEETERDGMNRLSLTGTVTGNLGEASQHLQQMRYLYPDNDWRVIDARVEVETWETLSRLTILSTERLKKAIELTERAVHLRESERAKQYLLPTIEAVQTIATIIGTRNKFYGQGLLGLVNLYRWMDVPQRAEKTVTELLEVAETVFGKVHPNYANANSVIGDIYLSEGRLTESEPHLREARAVFEKTVGTTSLEYAQSCFLLGRLYNRMHDYDNAEHYLNEALELQKRLNESKSEYAVTLNEFGNLYIETGRWEKAEKYLEIALRIRTQSGERDHVVLANLGHLFKLKGDLAKLQNNREIQRKYYKKAKEFFEKSLRLTGQLFGKESLAYSEALQRIGSYHISSEDYKLATSELTEALEVQKKILGNKHSVYLNTLLDLAVLYYRRQNYVLAQSLALEVVIGQSALVWDTASVQSERQQLLSMKYYHSTVDFLISCALRTSKATDHAVSDQMYEAIMSEKGAVSMYQKNMRLDRRNPELASLFTDLESTTSQLANLLFAEPRSDSLLAYYRAGIDKLTMKKELLESKLSDSQAFSAATRIQKLTTSQLKDVLPQKSVFIDFREINPPPIGASDGLSMRRLIAFVIQPSEPIFLLDLGPVAPIEKVLNSWNRQLRGMPPLGQDQVSSGSKLRDLIWRPLEDYAKSAKLILVSPEAIISRIPFAALPGNTRNTFLIEETETPIVTVPIPRLLTEILRQRGAEKVMAGGLLTVGGVDFDATPDVLVHAADAITSRVTQAWNRYIEETIRPGARAQASTVFQPLPGSEDEIQKIGEVFRSTYPQVPIRTLAKQNATKNEFRSESQGKEFIHIATHGFFSDPVAHVAPQSKSNGSFPSSLLPHGSASEEDIVKNNPGFLSGIALTGANKVHQFKGPAMSQADGILTATEVMDLDLTAADLVVLSACETGLGRVAGGEGVLGLQRAFQIAGARTVISSLWSVDDRMTRELMVHFYVNLWEKKLSKSEALRQAQLSILNGEPKRSTKFRGVSRVGDDTQDNKKGRVPPRFWAAWVVSGDPN